MPAFQIEKVGSDLILRNKYGVYSKNELEHQLLSGHLTVDNLREIYRLVDYQMTHVLRALGITYRNPLNDTRVLDATITPERHQLLLGTLSGDGYMKDPKSYGAGHSVYQLDYLYHKAEILHPFIATIGDRKLKTGDTVFFWTYHHDNFIPYFDRFYSQGKQKKYFRPGSIEGMDSRGLAYWYMDDGKYKEHGAYLCMGRIVPVESQYLLEYMDKVFSIKANLQAHDLKKGYYNLYIKAESRSHFFDLISPFVIPSMRYKLLGESPHRDFSDDSIVEHHVDLCKRVNRSIRYKGRVQEKVYELIKKYIPAKDNFIRNIQSDMENGRQISVTRFREPPSEESLKRMFLENNWPDKKVAAELGCSRNYASRLRRGLGIEGKRKRTR